MIVTKDCDAVDILILGTFSGKIKMYALSSMSKRGLIVAHKQVCKGSSNRW